MRVLLKKIKLFLIKSIHFFLLLVFPKKTILKKGKLGVTTIIGHKHVYMFVFSFHSFLYFFKKKIACTVIDDGTLREHDITFIKANFPGIKIVLHKNANKEIYKKLLLYPNIKKYRKLKLIDKFNLKLTDPFLLSDYEKIIYMDCDILFFRSPKEIISWTNKKYTQPLYIPERPLKDKDTEPGEWSILNNIFKDYIKIPIDSNFNSGLICINREQLDLDLLEKSIKYTHKIKLEYTWTPEQYALSTICAKHKAIALGKNYRHLIRKSDLTDSKKINYTLLHFAYLSKPLFWKYLLTLLLKTRFFNK